MRQGAADDPRKALLYVFLFDCCEKLGSYVAFVYLIDLIYFLKRTMHRHICLFLFVEDILDTIRSQKLTMVCCVLMSCVMTLASSVEVDVETNRDLGLADTKELLDRLYEQRLEEALAVMHKDTLDRGESGRGEWDDKDTLNRGKTGWCGVG